MDKKTIYLFFGEDSYSSSKKLKLWQKEFIKKHSEDGVEVFAGRKFDSSRFATNIEAVPFLSEKKLVIIKDFFSKAKKEDMEKVSKAIEKTPDFCILVFHQNGPVDKRLGLYKKIKKLGTATEFKEKTPSEITAFILTKARREEIKISPLTANYISTHCGTNLWTISNELKKLKLFAQDKEITSEMVNQLTTPSLSASIFKLTDTITEKNSRKALQVLKTLAESGEELTKVFFMIVRHFRILIQVHDMIKKNESRGTITKRLKQHPFVIQKTSAQSKNFTSEKLEEIYAKLLEIDKNFKTGVIRIQQGDNSAYSLAIEKLIIDCCQ